MQNSADKSGKKSIDEFVDLVGHTNRTYVQKWKNIDKLLKKEKETNLLMELSRLAYISNKNFDAITEIYSLADKNESIDTKQTINLLREIKDELTDGTFSSAQFKTKYH